MKIAIYSRKSKFTGKGESIENQIQLCKEYASKNFGINNDDIYIYEDEGFSGGSTDRPQFQLMLKHAKERRFNVLICYRLDRVSRNIADFASLIEELQDYEISFVSIREQFDTSTPMGRAMMYIASVFAQLERETLAERVRDNMIQLAKTGRWLGGNTPTGFESKEIIALDHEGKQRKAFKLTPVEEELNTVVLIYNKFLELKSLTKLETYCIQNNVKTRNNIDFSRFALRNILTNPVYAIADETLYNYFVENNYDVYASQNDFNGKNGIMAYNKTIQKKNQSNKQRDTSEWIIAVGAHVGIIESEKWVKVQNLINRNKSKSFRKVRSSESLLSGLLKCKDCGSFMRPKNGRINKDGVQIFYYMCEMKEKSKRTKCDIKNVNGNKLDKLVIDEIRRLSSTGSDLTDEINKNKINIDSTQRSLQAEINSIEKNIKENENAIANLVNALSQNQNANASKYIVEQINTLDEQNTKLRSQLNYLREKIDTSKNTKDNLDIMNDLLIDFSQSFNNLEIEEKRNRLRTIVDSITWDGKEVDVVLFGANIEKK